MSNKRLTPDQIEQVKQMAINGVAPADIAAHFKIAISTVHNHKSKFADAGVVMPNVRGQRPSGSVGGNDDADTQLFNNPSVLGKITATGNNAYRFILNGTRINISAEAAEINITKEGVEINF
jgi:hypothetical protein